MNSLDQDWLDYCNNPEGKFVDNFSHLFTEKNSQSELELLLPGNIFPSEVGRRLDLAIRRPLYKKERYLKQAIIPDLDVFLGYAKIIHDEEIVSAYKKRNIEILYESNEIMNLHQRDIPSSWLIGIISDAYHDCFINEKSVANGLFEACYGVTADSHASLYICAPMLDNPPILLDEYFDLFLKNIDYAVTTDSIYVLQS